MTPRNPARDDDAGSETPSGPEATPQMPTEAPPEAAPETPTATPPAATPEAYDEARAGDAPVRWPFAPPAPPPAEPAPVGTVVATTSEPAEEPFASAPHPDVVAAPPATGPVVAPIFAAFHAYYGVALCGEPVSDVLEVDGVACQVFENLVLVEAAPGVVRPRAIGALAVEALTPRAAPLEPGEMPPVRDLSAELPHHPSRKYATRPLSRIRYLVLHHTGAAPTVGPADIAAEHVDVNGWPGIGYHYLVESSGSIARLQDLTLETFHARQFNPVSVGVALAGDFSSDAPPTAQLEGAAALLAHLLGDLGLPTEAVRGHREMVPTPCPGDTFTTLWKPRLVRMIEARRSAVPAAPL